MCSTPKSASSLRSIRRIRIEPEDYQAYASMLRNASACYERNQALKAERSRLARLAGQDRNECKKNVAQPDADPISFSPVRKPVSLSSRITQRLRAAWTQLLGIKQRSSADSL
ncbi:MAG: hypothetical protein CVV06_00250 [Gammaproteobacteria bacterium HGW-Gammaproteobacteria-10]|nr:MAG: hypothetical protein CVV06_00250 [Gammaproteobacteria bacterium HGW-Gammaproteobacteria-10]